jgi:cellulose biosynthesis protein BcsQ
LAQAGYKVLAIDLDQQGTWAMTWGTGTRTTTTTVRRCSSLNSGTPLAPAKGIRENLDVVPAGSRPLSSRTR